MATICIYFLLIIPLAYLTVQRQAYRNSNSNSGNNDHGFSNIIQKELSSSHEALYSSYAALTKDGSLRNLLAGNDNGNLKDDSLFMNDANFNRVVTILENSIKQWSFIESQLMEPNVNLEMPEIFIPLKHFTTALEILGNIFYIRNRLTNAKECLERACPLMELLPAVANPVSKDKRISDSCFELLRDIYHKLYTKSVKPISSATTTDKALKNQSAKQVEESEGNQSQAKQNELKNELKNGLANGLKMTSRPIRVNDRHHCTTPSNVDDNSQGDNCSKEDYPTTSSDIETIVSELFRDLRSPFDQLRPSNPHSLLSSEGEIPSSEKMILHRLSSNTSVGNETSPNKTDEVNGKGTKPFKRRRKADASDSIILGDAEVESEDCADLKTSDALPIKGDKGDKGGDEISKTSRQIARKLESAISRFGHSDRDEEKRAIIQEMKLFYDTLHDTYPQLSYFEYAANMNVGHSFCELLEKAFREGNDFIGPELFYWQQLGRMLLMSSASKEVLKKKKSSHLMQYDSDQPIVIRIEEDDHSFTDLKILGGVNDFSMDDTLIGELFGSSGKAKELLFDSSQGTSSHTATASVATGSGSFPSMIPFTPPDLSSRLGTGPSFHADPPSLPFQRTEEASFVDREEAILGRIFDGLVHGSAALSDEFPFKELIPSHESSVVEVLTSAINQEKDFDKYFQKFSIMDRNRLLMLTAFDAVLESSQLLDGSSHRTKKASTLKRSTSFEIALGFMLGIADNYQHFKQSEEGPGTKTCQEKRSKERETTPGLDEEGEDPSALNLQNTKIRSETEREDREDKQVRSERRRGWNYEHDRFNEEDSLETLSSIYRYDDEYEDADEEEDEAEKSFEWGGGSTQLHHTVHPKQRSVSREGGTGERRGIAAAAGDLEGGMKMSSSDMAAAAAVDETRESHPVGVGRLDGLYEFDGPDDGSSLLCHDEEEKVTVCWRRRKETRQRTHRGHSEVKREMETNDPSGFEDMITSRIGINSPSSGNHRTESEDGYGRTSSLPLLAVLALVLGLVCSCTWGGYHQDSQKRKLRSVLHPSRGGRPNAIIRQKVPMTSPTNPMVQSSTGWTVYNDLGTAIENGINFIMANLSWVNCWHLLVWCLIQTGDRMRLSLNTAIKHFNEMSHQDSKLEKPPLHKKTLPHGPSSSEHRAIVQPFHTSIRYFVDMFPKKTHPTAAKTSARKNDQRGINPLADPVSEFSNPSQGPSPHQTLHPLMAEPFLESCARGFRVNLESMALLLRAAADANTKPSEPSSEHSDGPVDHLTRTKTDPNEAIQEVCHPPPPRTVSPSSDKPAADESLHSSSQIDPSTHPIDANEMENYSQVSVDAVSPAILFTPAVRKKAKKVSNPGATTGTSDVKLDHESASKLKNQRTDPSKRSATGTTKPVRSEDSCLDRSVRDDGWTPYIRRSSSNKSISSMTSHSNHGTGPLSTGTGLSTGSKGGPLQSPSHETKDREESRLLTQDLGLAAKQSSEIHSLDDLVSSVHSNPLPIGGGMPLPSISELAKQTQPFLAEPFAKLDHANGKTIAKSYRNAVTMPSSESLKTVRSWDNGFGIQTPRTISLQNSFELNQQPPGQSHAFNLSHPFVDPPDEPASSDRLTIPTSSLLHMILSNASTSSGPKVSSVFPASLYPSQVSEHETLGQTLQLDDLYDRLSSDLIRTDYLTHDGIAQGHHPSVDPKRDLTNSRLLSYIGGGTPSFIERALFPTDPPLPSGQPTTGPSTGPSNGLVSSSGAEEKTMDEDNYDEMLGDVMNYLGLPTRQQPPAGLDSLDEDHPHRIGRFEEEELFSSNSSLSSRNSITYSSTHPSVLASFHRNPSTSLSANAKMVQSATSLQPSDLVAPNGFARHDAETNTIMQQAFNYNTLSPNAPTFEPSYSVTKPPTPASPNGRHTVVLPSPLSPLDVHTNSQSIDREVTLPFLSQDPTTIPFLTNTVSSNRPSKEFAIVSLTSLCSVLDPEDTKTLKLVSNHFGGWDVEQGIQLRRSMANPALWGVTLRIPMDALESFQYKYMACDLNSNHWLENGVAHDLTSPLKSPLRYVLDGSPDIIEQEDAFQTASLLS